MFMTRTVSSSPCLESVRETVSVKNCIYSSIWGSHLFSQPLRLLLIGHQLLLPLLHVGISFLQRRHQFCVAVLQGEELGLQVHLTDRAVASMHEAASLSEMDQGPFYFH